MEEFTNFEKSVLKVIKKIPQGGVTTYSEVAKDVGHHKAVRAVGNVLRKNPNAPKTPCHRVVKSDGGIGGYKGGVKRKVELLRKEGVVVKNSKIVDFERVLYRY